MFVIWFELLKSYKPHPIPLLPERTLNFTYLPPSPQLPVTEIIKKEVNGVQVAGNIWF
jgi:hypothetical protein